MSQDILTVLSGIYRQNQSRLSFTELHSFEQTFVANLQSNIKRKISSLKEKKNESATFVSHIVPSDIIIIATLL